MILAIHISLSFGSYTSFFIFYTGIDMQLLNSSDGQFTTKQNYCAYLNILAIPQVILSSLRLNSAPFTTILQKKFNPEFCYVHLYKEVIFTILKNSESVISKHKAKLQKKLIYLEQNKNFIKLFHDKDEYALLIEDAKNHLNPEKELQIRQELQKLVDFCHSISHLKPEKIKS